MTSRTGLSRRGMLRAGVAGAAASTLPLASVHGQASGGRLTVGFWDHWVPAGNGAMRQIVEAWAKQNRVDVQIDFITSNGNKLLLTVAAEAQARQGHDILPFWNWWIHDHQRLLEPMDDVMGRLVQQHGPPNAVSPGISGISAAAGSACRRPRAASTSPARRAST